MPMNPRLLRPRLTGDPDAARYIAAVQLADGQQLEQAVRKAITDFVVGCKADGIWSLLKACCLLMGARTLSGALTPLVGTAPTNVNFVSGDYNRKTGLIGNGSTKYLNTNRSSTDDGQNDVHLAVYQSAAASSASDVFMTHVGAVQVSPSVVGTHIAEGFVSGNNTKLHRARDNNTTPAQWFIKPTSYNDNGLQGVSRSTSVSYVARGGGANTTRTIASLSQSSLNYYVLAQNNDNTVVNYSNARLAFYSIGSSLTLSLLDTRVTTLYNAIGAAI